VGDDAARKIVEFAARSEAAIITDVPSEESIRQLKKGSYDAKKKVVSQLRQVEETH